MMGYPNSEIIKYAEFALSNCSDSYRNEVYNTMISIVRRIDESNKKSTDS